MNDYKATVLQLLADIGGGDPPANGPVLSDAQFRSEVLRLLSAMSGGSGSGSGGGLVVNITRSGTKWKADKTFSDILEASASIPVVAKAVINGQTMFLPLQQQVEDVALVFAANSINYDGTLWGTIYTIEYDSENTISVGSSEFQLISGGNVE